MITIILVDKQSGQKIAICWDDRAGQAWMTDCDTSPPLKRFGETPHCVVALQRTHHLGAMRVDDSQSFAAALREYALTHAASPAWVVYAFVLTATDEVLTLSLVKADALSALTQLPSPIRETCIFLTEFFAGVPQTEQDRLIYTRLTGLWIPF